MTQPTNQPAAQRSAAELREHYQVERELADRLRRASRPERQTLYSAVYDELFRRVPHHPQLTRKRDAGAQRELVEHQFNLLRRFIMPETVYLEVGAGDCALALKVAAQARQVYAVDVSHAIADQGQAPANFALIISDGTSIAVPPASVTVAYSHQLMEHLHPDDALEQLRHIHHALAPGGRYICITPNRLSGPHDISKHFDPVATGLHLVEYTAASLAQRFRQVGFTRLTTFINLKGRYFACPLWLLRLLEIKLRLLPHRLRRRITSLSPVSGVLGLVLVGRK